MYLAREAARKAPEPAWKSVGASGTARNLSRVGRVRYQTVTGVERCASYAGATNRAGEKSERSVPVCPDMRKSLMTSAVSGARRMPFRE